MIYIHWAFLAIYLVITITVMVAVLMDNREPSKTMAWILVLWFLPLLGIILYIFFGQNVRKERFISQRSMDQLTKRSMTEYTIQRDLRLPESQRTLITLFSNQNFALPFKNNNVDILTDGYQFFPSLLNAIGKARHHIHIDIFIFENDATGNLIADALIDRARHGVEVRILYDDVGCWSTPNRFFERMRLAGIEVHPFLPVKLPAFTSKANYRNHRKLIIIDGTVGFVGGMNIADRYIKGTKRQPWRDTMLRIEGAGVYGLQRAFLVDWYFVDRTLITDRKYYPDINPLISNNCLMQLVTSNPITPWPDIMQGYMRILMQARRYVYMETPYFLPTEPIIFAMRTAALAGVDIRLIIPAHSDSPLTARASRSFVAKVMEAGVGVWLYEAGFNHSKLLVSDDIVSTVGSTNIDFRSFVHDFESNAFFYDEGMALRIKKVFLNDQSLSTNVHDVAQFHHRPFFTRLVDSIIRLFSPLM